MTITHENRLKNQNIEIDYCSDCQKNDDILCKRDADAKCLICGDSFCGAHIGPHLKNVHCVSLNNNHCAVDNFRSIDHLEYVKNMKRIQISNTKSLIISNEYPLCCHTKEGVPCPFYHNPVQGVVNCRHPERELLDSYCSIPNDCFLPDLEIEFTQ
jgi:hypothetical protein